MIDIIIVFIVFFFIGHAIAKFFLSPATPRYDDEMQKIKHKTAMLERDIRALRREISLYVSNKGNKVKSTRPAVVRGNTKRYEKI